MKTVWQGKIQRVVRYGVEDCRDFSRLKFFRTVPRVLGIHIGRNVISLHLDVRRHTDLIPSGKVITIRPEPVRCGGEISCVVETPDTVQAVLQAALPCMPFLPIPVCNMVGVCGKAVVRKNSRVFYQLIITVLFH